MSARIANGPPDPRPVNVAIQRTKDSTLALTRWTVEIAGRALGTIEKSPGDPFIAHRLGTPAEAARFTNLLDAAQSFAPIITPGARP